MAPKNPAHRTRFDWIFDSRPVASHDPWDTPLVESASFVAIPSVGAIVPGWVLIIPRVEIPNLAMLAGQARAELAAVRERVVAILARTFTDRLFEFEHGPVKADGLLACGVEQAHLHIVPLPFDLVEAIEMSGAAGPTKCVSSKDPWDDVEAGRDYWLSRDIKSRSGILTYPVGPISQGIRRIIADRTGKAHAWDYREFRHEENVNITLAAFGASVTI